MLNQAEGVYFFFLTVLYKLKIYSEYKKNIDKIH